MKELNNNTIGFITGSFIGLWHLLWVLLIAIGLAQPLMDWIFELHLLSNPFHVLGFDLGRAISLVVVTFTVGYIMGWIFSLLWNFFLKRS